MKTYKDSELFPKCLELFPTFKDLEPIPTSGHTLPIIEIEDPKNSYLTFHVHHNENSIVLGSICNAGFIPHHYMEKDNAFTLDQHLETIMDILNEAVLSGETIPDKLEM
jgi:hypothetical protein